MSLVHITWFALLLCTCHGVNEYSKETGPNGEDIWRSTSDFIPLQSKSYGTIKLGQIMSVEFDFIWGGRTNTLDPEFECFFRIGYNASLGTTCDGEAARYPSFWLSNASNTMHVSTSNGTHCHAAQSLHGYGSITAGTSYHITISFNNTALEVHVSTTDRPHWNKRWFREPTQPQYIGDDLPIWFMSNTNRLPLYIPGNGTFSNIVITSHLFTTHPTSDSTTFESTKPTPNPTQSTTTPTYTPTRILESETDAIPSVNNNNGSVSHIAVIIIINVAVVVALCCILIGIVLLCRKRINIKRKTSSGDTTFNNFSYDPRKRSNLECEMNVNRHEYVPTLTATETAHVMAEMCHALAADGLYGADTNGMTPDGALNNPYSGYQAVAQTNEDQLTPAEGGGVDMNAHNLYLNYTMEHEEDGGLERRSGSGDSRGVFLQRNADEEEESEFDTSDDDVVTSNKYANMQHTVNIGSVFTFDEATADPNVAKSEFERHYVSQVRDSFHEITRFTQSQLSHDGPLSPRTPMEKKVIIGDEFDEIAHVEYPYQMPNAYVDPPNPNPNPYHYQYAGGEVLPQQNESDNPSTDLDDLDNPSTDLDNECSTDSKHVSSKPNDSVSISLSSSALNKSISTTVSD